MKCLCFSTAPNADVVGHPDSDKMAAFAAPSYAEGQQGRTWVRTLFRADPSLGSYDGEDMG